MNFEDVKRIVLTRFFERNETRDLAISILVISLIFSAPNFVDLFLTSLIVVISSFFFHEMGHKFVAKKFGCMATYRIWPSGLALGLLSMVFRFFGFGLIFIAPGFVEIMPYSFGRWGFRVVKLSSRDLGLISLSGIGINLFLAFFFKLFQGDIFHTISYVNAILAFFNLLPIRPLDGSKVFTWNVWIWLFLMIMASTLVFIF